jgi:putative peptidoglycan lipid II flippase
MIFLKKTNNNLNFNFKEYLFPIFSSTIGLFIILFSQIVFANFFGTGLEADNYSWVIGTVTIIFGLSHNSFKNSITPIFLDKKINKENYFGLSVSFYLYYLLIQSILVLLIYLNLELILISLTKFEFSRVPDLKNLFILFLPFVFLKGFTTINYAILSSLSKFKFQFFIEKILNPLTFLFSIIFLHKEYGIKSAVIGMNIAALLLFSGSFISVLRKINLRKINFNFKSKFIEFLKFDLVYKSTYLVSLFAELTSKYILSGLQVGSTAYINYADKILKISDVSFNTSISPVLLTDLSKSINDNKKNLIKRFENIFQVLAFIIIPFTFYIFFSSEEIIKILFYRGEFGLESVNFTKTALKLMIFSTISVTLLVLNNKIYASSKDSKTGLYISVPCYCIFGFNYYLLGSYYGFLGIAIAISINSFISLFISSFLIYRIHFKFDYKKLILVFLKYLIVGAVIGFFTNFITSLILVDPNSLFYSLFYLLLFIASFLISYILLLFILNDDLARKIFRYMKIIT